MSWPRNSPSTIDTAAFKCWGLPLTITDGCFWPKADVAQRALRRRVEALAIHRFAADADCEFLDLQTCRIVLAERQCARQQLLE